MGRGAARSLLEPWELDYNVLMHARPPKVLVAMSGGVDSSVAAALLKQQGYNVVGCFMRLGSDRDDEAEYDNIPSAGCDTRKPHKQGCCSVNDASDARLVAAKLDIPFYVLNFKKDFDRIINYFVDEYNAGRTPNPCIRCNDWLKFGKLDAYAQSIDADYVATGHYARINHSSDPPRLLTGIDASKDQSYVLFGAPHQRLKRMLLPIGELEKSYVRQLAQDLDLPVYNKPDSQEICFVPDNDYAQLVRKRSPEAVAPGTIRDTAGNTLGEHPGHQHYTVGQRRGLNLALGYPIYVTHRDPQGNTVTVGQKQDLLAQQCSATDANWLVPPAAEWTPCHARVRYNGQPHPAHVRATDGNALEVKFTQPLEAITPGQAIVCYQDEQLIAGGWIKDAW